MNAMPIEHILTHREIDQFKVDGAVIIKGKFSRQWIEKLRDGIDVDIRHPSPRLARHTKDEATGYKNGDNLSGKMFPTLFEVN